MIIWHVQRLYTSEGCIHVILPYDLRGTLKGTLKMKKGIRQMVKFMLNSRLTERSAYLLCKKKNMVCGCDTITEKYH